MSAVDIQGAHGKNCLYINEHSIQETSDVTAICGPEGNLFSVIYIELY